MIQLTQPMSGQFDFEELRKVRPQVTLAPQPAQSTRTSDGVTIRSLLHFKELGVLGAEAVVIVDDVVHNAPGTEVTCFKCTVIPYYYDDGYGILENMPLNEHGKFDSPHVGRQVWIGTHYIDRFAHIIGN